MQWEVIISLRTQPFVRRRFIRGLVLSGLLIVGSFLILWIFGWRTLQTEPFLSSGFGYLFLLVSLIWLLMVIMIGSVQAIPYRVTYQIDEKRIQINVKSLKTHPMFLTFFDFLNAAIYGRSDTVPLHRFGSHRSMKLTWKRIRSARVLKRCQVVVLKGSPGESMPLYFEDQYHEILQWIQKHQIPLEGN